MSSCFWSRFKSYWIVYIWQCVECFVFKSCNIWHGVITLDNCSSKFYFTVKQVFIVIQNLKWRIVVFYARTGQHHSTFIELQRADLWWCRNSRRHYWQVHWQADLSKWYLNIGNDSRCTLYVSALTIWSLKKYNCRHYQKTNTILIHVR